jgi:putative transposase
MSGPKPVPITVTDAQRNALQALVHKASEEHALVTRARMILMADLGHSTRAIARYLHVSQDCVCDWKQRWRECAKTGLGETQVRDWLLDAPRSGHPPTITAEQWCQIMALACSDPKESGRPISQWTIREIADEAVKRNIVEHLSAEHLGQFFKRSRSQAASMPLLADPASRSASGGSDPGCLQDL